MSMRALRQLTEHADQQHREAMKTIHDDLGEAHLEHPGPGRRGQPAQLRAQPRPRRGDRRLRRRAGAGRRPGPGGHGPDGHHHRRFDIPDADLTLVRFAQGLELALQAAYGGIVATGKLTGAPLQSARTFARHHGEHADALTTLLPKERRAAPRRPRAGGQRQDPGAVHPEDRRGGRRQRRSCRSPSTSRPARRRPTSWPWARSSNWQTAAVVATIEPIEAQHAVVWGQTLDLPIDQWMPAFQTHRRRPEPVPVRRQLSATSPRSTRDMDVNRDEMRRQLQRIAAGPRRGGPPLPRGAQAGLRPRHRRAPAAAKAALLGVPSRRSFLTVGGATVARLGRAGRVRQERKQHAAGERHVDPGAGLDHHHRAGQRRDRPHPVAHGAVDRGAGRADLPAGASTRT